jgi:hypothetical protein
VQDFNFDPETYGQIMEHCLRDPLFVRYQRERLELIYEHLDTTEDSPELVARFDPLKKKGILKVRGRDGKQIVQTEVRSWH